MEDEAAAHLGAQHLGCYSHRGMAGGGGANGKNPAKKKYEAVVVPNAEQIFQQEIMDSCILRFFMSGLAGGAMGAVMGLVFGSFSLEMTPGVCLCRSPLIVAPSSSGPARQVWLASHGGARCHPHTVTRTIDTPQTTEREATSVVVYEGMGGFGAGLWRARLKPAARWCMSRGVIPVASRAEGTPLPHEVESCAAT